MTGKAPKRPKDANQLAKLIVELSTNDGKEGADTKDSAAVSLGRRGGLKGGPARAEKLTSERRSEIAKKAAEKRWKSKHGEGSD